MHGDAHSTNQHVNTILKSAFEIDIALHVLSPNADTDMHSKSDQLLAKLQADCPTFAKCAAARAYCSKTTLRRYLRARGGDVDKAFDALKETLKWRYEVKPWTIKSDTLTKQLALASMQSKPSMIYSHGLLQLFYHFFVLVLLGVCFETQSTDLTDGVALSSSWISLGATIPCRHKSSSIIYFTIWSMPAIVWSLNELRLLVSQRN